MKKLFFLFSIILFISCTPQKQLNRLRIRHPELFQSTNITDTVLIPGFSFDTTFKFSQIFELIPTKIKNLSDLSDIQNSKPDTFNLEKKTEYGNKKSFKMQIVRDQDKLKVSGELPSDTIKKTIYIETYKSCERKHLEDYVKTGVWVGSIVLAIFFIMFIIIFIKRNFL